jgi:serine/threonine-protein kinase HipA
MRLFYERHLIGEIVEPDNAAPALHYEPAWLEQEGAFALSTTMPLRAKPWEWPILAPWLINLLPEDNDAIRMMARILDVPHTDVLALLETLSYCPLVHFCVSKRLGCWSNTLT